MLDVSAGYREKLCSAAKAAAMVPISSTLAVAMGAGALTGSCRPFADRVRADDLTGLRLYDKVAMEPLVRTLLAADVVEKVDAHPLILAGADHALIRRGAALERKQLSFVPAHFTMLPGVLTEGIHVDTFIATVSPIDRHGFFSLGTKNANLDSRANEADPRAR